MIQPSISVIMSVYNGERFLRPAIDSILAQTFGDFEFLILDDGSSDGSGALLQDYAAHDARIRLIQRENKGLIASLNELIAAARAPLLARMDADDVALPERFARQIDFLTAHPDCGVVGTQRINIDEAGRRIDEEGPHYALDHDQFLGIIGEHSLLCHSSVMMRADLVRSVGGYHAAFRHCEDFDLWLRLAGVTRLCSLPDALLCYRHSPDQVSKRHIVELQTGTAIALAAYRERTAGRPDPTATLAALPPLGELDALFGRSGMEREALGYLVPHICYSEVALRGDGLARIARLLDLGGYWPGLWRTVLRLVRMGEPVLAVRLAAMLVQHGVRGKSEATDQA
jgi:GT2 family glycosyltransferase